VREVAALSSQITLQVHDFVAESDKAKEFGVKRIPAIVLSGQAKGTVRFLGIPSGYEFAALIEDLVDVASGETDLSPKVAEELLDLKKDVHIQVFSTPT
jgi:alkyl hydroperoxide reductase subunit AhpF